MQNVVNNGCIIVIMYAFHDRRCEFAGYELAKSALKERSGEAFSTLHLPVATGAGGGEDEALAA